MSNPRSPRASAIPFGHLLGLGPKGAKGRAEDDNKPDDADAAAAEGEDDEDEHPDDAKKGKKAGKAKEGDDDQPDADDEDGDADAEDGEDGDDPDAEESDEDEDKDDAKKGKKAGKVKKADEDDDGEARGRKAERARWSKVLGHKHAGQGRVAAACNMLTTTDMTASAIISTLSTLPQAAPAAGRGLYDRMASVPNADIGGDGKKPGAPTGNKAKDKASQFLAAAHAANPDRIIAPRNAG